MYEISCEMCMDLMPLVNDGVASDDSRASVENHIKTCESCRALYAGEGLPEGNEKKALSKVVGRIRFFALLLLAAGVIVGICLTERIMSGLSAVFVVLVFLAGALLRFAFVKGSGIKNKALRILAFACAAALVVGILLFANALVGNPVSQVLAENAVDAYLARQYPGTDFYAERVTFNFKNGEYYAVITSPASVDSHFEVDIDMLGNVTGDDYEHCVANGMNTANRIDREYRELVDPILLRLNLSYTLHIGYGEITLSGSELGLDQVYDMRELGARAGHLTVCIRDEVVTEERAAEILLEIKKLMDENGGAFRTIDFRLIHPKPEDGGQTPEGSVEVLNFLYEDIYGDGLSERVRAANQEAVAYWARQNENR